MYIYPEIPFALNPYSPAVYGPCTRILSQYIHSPGVTVDLRDFRPPKRPLSVGFGPVTATLPTRFWKQP